LLKRLDIKGSIITIDAMGTQKNIANQIIGEEADYMLALKGNRSRLHQDVVDYFDYLEQQSSVGNFHNGHNYYEDINKGHGRLEVRQCYAVRDINCLESKEEWKKLSSLVKIKKRVEYLPEGRITCKDMPWHVST